MIIDEPVRGSVPPPWFWALPGIERMQAFTAGLLPVPPLSRMQGIRPAHVGPGSGTWTMPASASMQGFTGVLDPSAFLESALTGVAMTALPPGMDATPLTLSVNYFRPSRPEPGNLLARARILNASSISVFVDVEVEDPRGRRIVQAGSHCAIRPVEPPPPPPPAELRLVDEPDYGTPDPYLRPISCRVAPLEVWQERDGLSVMREHRATPFSHFYGFRFEEIDDGHIVVTVAASEWFCRWSRHVAPGVIAALANGAGWAAGLTCLRPGDSFVGLEQVVRFHRPVLPDGRTLRAEARIVSRDHELCVTEVSVHDADGVLVASETGAGAYIAGSRRRTRLRPEAKRILATLLFTDIVGSTEHAERLGDARWRALLDEHHAHVRREIAGCEGVEVNTAGDGFFVRFDSPARALECARAIHAAVRRLGIEVRTGIHTGECEVQGRNLAGMAVHIAARVQAAAAAGEILATSTVRDLAVGSGLRFEGRGEYSLKGVPDEWRLFALAE